MATDGRSSPTPTGPLPYEIISTEGSAMDRPLLRSLRDPVEERLLRESLKEQAADNSDPLARDLARDVLDGNVTVYDAAASSVYGEVFAQRGEAHVRWWFDLPEDERERLYADGKEAIAQAREEGR